MKASCSVTLKSLSALFSALLAPAFVAQADDANLIAEGAKVEVVSEGNIFTEGPAVDRDGTCFSPISRTTAS